MPFTQFQLYTHIMQQVVRRRWPRTLRFLLTRPMPRRLMVVEVRPWLSMPLTIMACTLTPCTGNERHL